MPLLIIIIIIFPLFFIISQQLWSEWNKQQLCVLVARMSKLVGCLGNWRYLSWHHIWLRAQHGMSFSNIGSALLKQLEHNTKIYFPEIWDELTGMAVGADINASDLFLWNAKRDFLHRTDDGCTYVGVNRPNEQFLAHNEDGDPFLCGHCHMVDIIFTDTSDVGFVSFYYPGSLPGHSFAVNYCGIVQTINNLRIKPTT
jgi:hypothetical protein